jgi:dienelactone hydrolase
LKRRYFLAGLFVLVNVAAAGQPQRPPFTPPENIDYRKAGIISEGTRMAAELFALKSLAGQALPTILMAHGWGGTAAQLRTVGLEFARAGYFVVTFDYRGWGESDSRLVLTGAAPAEKKANRFSAEVQEVREVVDPLDMTTDWLNALHWLQGEPQCDKARIGLWGTSYSGGHVVYVAARDPRVKVIVSQVGSLDSRFLEPKLAFEEGTKRARGEIGYPPPRARTVGNLSGAPVREKLLLYAPVEDVEKAANCAMLFIIAEKEELFDNKDHAIKAHDRAKGPKKLITIPGITHYGIYTTARAEATRHALEWFDQYLKKQ